MSNLVIGIFDNASEAEQARRHLLEKDRNGAISLEDIITAEKTETGNVRFHHVTYFILAKAIGCAFMGLLFGLTSSQSRFRDSRPCSWSNHRARLWNIFADRNQSRRSEKPGAKPQSRPGRRFRQAPKKPCSDCRRDQSVKGRHSRDQHMRSRRWSWAMPALEPVATRPGFPVKGNNLPASFDDADMDRKIFSSPSRQLFSPPGTP